MIGLSSYYPTLGGLELTGHTAKASTEHTQSSNINTYLVSGTVVADIFYQFKENPDAWLLVDKILQKASYPQTKC